MKQYLLLLLTISFSCYSLAQENRSYKIFQFPANSSPRVDGKNDDWAIVPDSFTVGADQLVNDSDKAMLRDPKNLDVRIKVGWV